MCWGWEISSVAALLGCFYPPWQSISECKQGLPYKKCQINLISVTVTWCDRYDLQNYA